MKTFQRINLIGILCISFGVYALLSKGMLMIMFARHQMGAGVTPQQPVWMMVSPTFELLVDMVYLVAGIFFLKKKSFSLMLMYTALILSLLSNFVPVIILGFQQAKIP
ncbi:MAG TPA: hypothetical protein DCF33_08445, partial [Saprospirales bacterium]|nr:hypothetical protein [Saprospirales bacterium]